MRPALFLRLSGIRFKSSPGRRCYPSPPYSSRSDPPRYDRKRWVAYPHPQVVFQYYDGRTGELAYAESISTLGN